MRKEQVKKLRHSLGLSQQKLADYLGLKDKSQIVHLETGRTHISGPIARLLFILKTTNGELFLERDAEGRKTALIRFHGLDDQTPEYAPLRRLLYILEKTGGNL